MEKSFPFNAVVTDGVADRVYSAEDFAAERAAGFSPMLCAPPELVRSLPDGGRAFPLWLLSWNVPEYRAMQFCPRIWQYDSGFADGVTVRIPRNRGYFGSRMPDVRRIT